MTELKEKQYPDLRGWVGESHVMRAVVAASALEGGGSIAPHTKNLLPLEANQPQLPLADSLDPVIRLRGPFRAGQIEFNTGLLTELTTVITEHIDAVAAQLNVTPDQLYSMTFADFVARHEEKEKLPKKQKSLTERFNEAYDEDAEQEDEQFFKSTRKYYSSRFSAED